MSLFKEILTNDKYDLLFLQSILNFFISLPLFLLL